MMAARFREYVRQNLLCWQQDIMQEDVLSLRVEHDNFLQAAEMGLVVRDFWEQTAVFLLQAYPLAESWALWRRWTPYLETAVSHTQNQHLPIYIQLLNRLGRTYRLNHQHPKALATHQQAQHLIQPTTPTEIVAEVHLNLAEDYTASHDYDLAHEAAQQAWVYFADSHTDEKNNKVAASTQNTLGLICLATGSYHQAKAHIERAIRLWPHTDDPIPLARMQKNLGHIYQNLGQFSEAMTHYQDALSKVRYANNKIDQAELENNIGIIYFLMNRFEEAENIFKNALQQTLPAPARASIRASLAHNLAETYLHQGRLLEAAIYIQQAVTWWQEFNDKLQLGNSTGVFGTILRHQAVWAEAAVKLEEAIELLQEFPKNQWAKELIQEFAAELALCPKNS